MSLFNPNKSSDDHDPEEPEESPLILDGEQLEFEQVKRGWDPDQVIAWVKATSEQHQHDLDLASERLRDEQATAKSRIEQLTAELETAKRETAEALETADQVIAAGKDNGTVVLGSAESDEQKSALSEQIEDLQHTINTKDQEHSEVTEQLNAALAEIEVLQNDLGSIEQQRDDLKREVASIKENEHAERHVDVQAVTDAAERRVAEAEGIAEALRDQLTTVQRDFDVASGALATATNDLVGRDQELVDAQAQTQQMTQDLESLRQQVHSVCDQRDALQVRVDELAPVQEQVQDLTEKLTTAELARDEFASDVRRLTSENQALPKLLRDSDRADRAERQLEKLREEATENIRTLAHAQARVDLLTSEIERVRSEHGQWGESARHIASAMEDARASQNRELADERARAQEEAAALVDAARSEADEIRLGALASGSDLDSSRQEIIDTISKHRADALQSAESKIREIQQMSRQYLETIRQEEQTLIDDLISASTTELDRLTREKNLVADSIDEMRKTAHALTDTVIGLKQEITEHLSGTESHSVVDPLPVAPEPRAETLDPLVTKPRRADTPHGTAVEAGPPSIQTQAEAVTLSAAGSAAGPVDAEPPFPLGPTANRPETSTAIPMPAVDAKSEQDRHAIFTDLEEPAPPPAITPTPAAEDATAVDLFALDDDVAVPTPDLSGLPQPGAPLIFNEDD